MTIWRRLGFAFLEGCSGFVRGAGVSLVANFVFFVFLNAVFFPGVEGAGLMVVTGIGFLILPLVAGVLFFIVRFIRGWRHAIPTGKLIQGLDLVLLRQTRLLGGSIWNSIKLSMENDSVSAVLKRKSFIFKFAFGLIQIIWFVTAFWLIQEGWSYTTARHYPDANGSPFVSSSDQKLFLVIGFRPADSLGNSRRLRLFDLREWNLRNDPAWTLQLPRFAVMEGKAENEKFSAQFRVEEIGVNVQQITVDGKDYDHTMTVVYQQSSGITIYPFYLRTRGPEHRAAGFIGAFLTSLLLWKLAAPLVLRKLG